VAVTVSALASLALAAPAGATSHPSAPPRPASAHPHGAAPSGTWSSAFTAPGTVALNVGGTASITTIACPGPGDCSAAGYYNDATSLQQGMVVNEVNGTWQTARAIPGLAGLNAGGDAEIETISCSSVGNCVLGGQYRDVSGNFQVFVVAEVNGTWQPAGSIPGLDNLNTNGSARIYSISCASSGSCTAGGYYADSASSGFQAWVATEASGTWSGALEVPGTAALNVDAFASLTSVSCPTSSSCTAVGYYDDASNAVQGWVISMVSGIWGTATDIPGLVALNAGSGARALTISCAAPGDCVTGGFYTDGSKATQAFIAEELLSTWSAAEELNGSDTLNAGGAAQVSALDCTAVEACTVVGYSTDATGSQQAMVDAELNDVWGAAQTPSGADALNAGGTATLSAVSCATSTECVASGFYTDTIGHSQALVAIQAGSAWTSAQAAPGSIGLNIAGDASLPAVACAPQGTCTAGGFYSSGAATSQAMLDDFIPPPVSFPTPTARTSLAALAGGIWTVDATHQRLIELRESDGVVLRTVAIPGATEVASDGAHLWVTSKAASNVVEVTASGGILRRVRLPAGPSTLSVGPNRVYVADATANEVSIVTASNGAVTSFRVAARPLDVGAAGAAIFVLVAGNRLYDYSAAGRLVRTVIVGAGATRMTATAAAVYVASPTAATISVVTPSNGHVRTIHGAGTGAFKAIVVGPYLFVTDTRSARVTVVVAANGAASRTFAAIPAPTELVADGGYVWVLSPTSQLLTKISTST